MIGASDPIFYDLWRDLLSQARCPAFLILLVAENDYTLKPYFFDNLNSVLEINFRLRWETDDDLRGEEGGGIGILDIEEDCDHFARVGVPVHQFKNPFAAGLNTAFDRTNTVREDE